MSKIIKLTESQIKKLIDNTILEEKSKHGYEIYHDTYTSAIHSALDYVKSKGYEYDNDEVYRKIGLDSKKPSEGQTTKVSITLFKDNKEQKKSLHIQVYGMPKKYELNCYIN